jgi:diguanylate cyclase
MNGNHLSISLGASQYQDGDTPVGFIERADAAMYRAKRGGRNRVEMQQPVIRDPATPQ